MIKSIELQRPAKITIIKNGEVVADLYVPGIHGGIDTNKIKVETYGDTYDGTYHIKLEV